MGPEVPLLLKDATQTDRHGRALKVFYVQTTAWREPKKTHTIWYIICKISHHTNFYVSHYNFSSFITRYIKLFRVVAIFPLKSSKKDSLYTIFFNNHQLWILPTEYINGFRMILTVNSDYFQNSINQLIFVMVKSCVFFAVRTEFLNII
jgi:hypothetical protein